MSTNEKIKLDITSAFDPGGFAKASNAVKGLGVEMKKGGKAANELLSAFGTAEGAIGNVASTMSKLGAAFKGGGGWALAAAGVALLISKYVELREAAEKVAEETRKAWKDDLIKKMESSLSGLKDKYAKITDEIERGAKAAEKIAKAYEGLAKSEISVSNAESDRIVALLEGEKQSALVGVEDPVKRKAIELDYESQIFDSKKKAAQFERDQKAWMANQKVETAEGSLAAGKNTLSVLQAKAEELKATIAASSSEEYLKKNPMPSAPEGGTFKGLAASTVVGGATGAAAWGIKSQLDQMEYRKKMDTWIKESGSFTPEQERIKKDAVEELLKVQSGISDATTSVKELSIGVSSSKNERDSILKVNDASSTRQDIVQGGLADNQSAFEKTLSDYQTALDERVKVEEQITRKEEEISRLKEKEKDREDKKIQWNQQAAQAKQLGAAGWNQQQTAAANDKEDADKGTQKEAKWVSNAMKRMSTGAKLSKGEMERIGNFNDFQKLQGVNPFDPGNAAAKQLQKLDDNLKELKGLRADLQNAIKIN